MKMCVCERLIAYLALISAVFNPAWTVDQSDHLSSKNSHSVVMDYMVQLKKNLTDINGKPKLSNSSDPTEAWALQDLGE